MRKAGIHKALDTLIDERRPATPAARMDIRPCPDDPGADFTVNIGGLRVLNGLGILAESLIKALLDRGFFGPCDVHIEQPVLPDLQPELHAAGLRHVSFYARLTVLENLPRIHAELGHQIRHVFNAIQNDDLYATLFPAPGHAPRGVLFPFHRDDDADATGCFHLVEHEPTGRFLRITLESASDMRLRMTHIPHRIAPTASPPHTRADIPRAAAAITQGIIETCARRALQYGLEATRLEEYFQWLRTAGFDAIAAMDFTWHEPFVNGARSLPARELQVGMARILHALGDTAIAERLQQGRILRLDDGARRIYLDLSQRNRCLNVAFDMPRARVGMSDCLARLPAVLDTARALPTALRGTRVLLIHHMTAEVLGFIQALADMGAAFTDTLWVKYAGVIEPAFREIILSQPEALFRFSGIAPAPESDGITRRFLLAAEHAATGGLDAAAELLRATPHSFFEAMRRTAGHILLDMVVACRRRGEKCLIIEDGAYIAPAIHRLCLERRSVAAAARWFGFPADRIPAADHSEPFGDWLRPALIGGVEHTRNGHDALREVADAFQALAFPNLSIATSAFKVNTESQAVADTCITAIESILHGMGFTLAARTPLVLGAQGTVGRKVMRRLAARLEPERLFGVDVAPATTAPPWFYAASPDALPDDALAEIDLIFGMVGQSICRAPWIERWLSLTRKRHLFMASGSTKTAEFSDFAAWLAARAAAPGMLNSAPLTMQLTDIRDPKSGMPQGRSACLEFGGRQVTLHMLADLMPVNFLYYGVPAETMNCVMNELLIAGAALAGRHAARAPYPSTLLALDHEIPLAQARADAGIRTQ